MVFETIHWLESTVLFKELKQNQALSTRGQAESLFTMHLPQLVADAFVRPAQTTQEEEKIRKGAGCFLGRRGRAIRERRRTRGDMPLEAVHGGGGGASSTVDPRGLKAPRFSKVQPNDR